jgi:hypothetical protein
MGVFLFFDRQTEEKRKSDLAKVAQSVEEQTKMLNKLITLLETEQLAGSKADGAVKEQAKIVTKLIALPEKKQSAGSEADETEVELKE